MNKQQAEALLDLADFLVGEGEYVGKGLPPKKFNMDYWQRVTAAALKEQGDRSYDFAAEFFELAPDGHGILPKHCKTVGCAIGWGITLPKIRALGLYLSENYWPMFGTLTHLSAIAGAFDISHRDASLMFESHHYIGPVVPPAHVALRIRRIVHKNCFAPDEL